MTTPRSIRTRPGRAARAAIVLAGSLLAVTACTSDGEWNAARAAAGDEATDAAGACVADIEAVVTAEPTAASNRALPDELVAELDAAAQASFERDVAAPGAIVGVRTPEGTWTAAYGLADPDRDEPMEVGMHTRIGSVTKTFTGTALMQLVEAGELSLDDTIDTYVADVPNGDRITLRQLANMTSGLQSYTKVTEFTDTYFAAPETVFDADELIEVGLDASPVFEPGEQFDYSNTNTLLLGKVIEEVTGRPLAEVFDEQIFEPLGLEHTSWPGESPELPEPFAQGFTLQGDAATPEAPSNATNWNPAWGDAAGEMISNMDDLLVYGRALVTGQGLVDPETQIERLSSLPAPGGYGIALGCIDGWVGHTGELPGYNTSVFFDTGNDTLVVVQTNSDIASGDCPESPVLADDPGEVPCMAPATRLFVALSKVLGHEFTPNPMQ